MDRKQYGKMSEILIKKYVSSQYTVLFDKGTGFFLRVSENDEESFMNIETPELLDISITNYCEKECSFCYRSSNKRGKHMSFADYCRIINEAQKIGVLQVALGGGNPNQHPDFIRILEYTRCHSIIPSYTTNGQGMSDEIYEATKRFCGALAVSWYSPYNDAIEAINRCIEYGIKINIHFLLSRETISEAINLLHNKELLKYVNAIIFLNYKPIHSSPDLCLNNDEIFHKFIDTITDFNICKIGFDSCMISYLTSIMKHIKSETIDYCEAARFSAFISEDLMMYPCSFMCDTEIRGVDLKEVSIQDAWKNGDDFILTREMLKTPSRQKFAILKCKECNAYEFCHGGCQFFNINMCRY